MNKDYGEYFNVAHCEPRSYIYGPGARYVVWFQGCALACSGCWNREMWSFKPNWLIHREQLLVDVLSAPEIRGVTFLGGEPLHQAQNLWWLIRAVREKSDLTIFLYTGYEKHELSELDQQSNIDEFCDIIALGRYVSDSRNTNQQWIGSSNQSVIYPALSRETSKPTKTNQVEIVINPDESVRVLGFPDADLC